MEKFLFSNHATVRRGRVGITFPVRSQVPWLHGHHDSEARGEIIMPFIDIDIIPALTILPGCRLRTPYGQNIMLSYLEMEGGAEVPLHHHPHEQAGMLLKGRLELTIGDETRVVEAGAMFIIPPNTPHRAVAVGGPAVVLDVFSPVREDYADLYNKYIPTPRLDG